MGRQDAFEEWVCSLTEAELNEYLTELAQDGDRSAQHSLGWSEERMNEWAAEA